MASVIQIVVSPHGFTANDVGPIAVSGHQVDDLVNDQVDDYVAAVVAALEGIDFSNLSNITVTGSEGGLVVLSHAARHYDQSSGPATQLHKLMRNGV